MKYEFILFDIDDTLFDFKISEERALHNTFTKYQLPTGFKDYKDSYGEISKVLWGNLEEGSMSIKKLGTERFKRLFEAHKLEIDAHQFSSDYLDYLGKETTLMPGATEVCEILSKDYRLAIITNGFTAVQEARIQNSPLRNYFEQSIISESVGSQKPHREIFDDAFSKLNILEKEKVLIVGDSLTSDIQGGLNYGIDTCWFNPHHKENTLGIKPTYVIHELNELLEMLEKTNAPQTDERINNKDARGNKRQCL